MNQKSITNQILTRELSLNSTLNYLFNISNMKKLFTYLLISSMVVLSSCTNYDDQFDDLNSQLTTLKSQIEGFSSLSSGVTALQGTVSALQTAVAALPKTTTPATDISGLQTALTALAATVAELKTSLATAATSSEVAALTASLTKVQTDLSELLAANNVYTPGDGGLVINSAASLTVAEALGDRLAIVNGGVTITNGVANALDATKLAAVVAKIGTVTNKLTYVHSGTGVTSVNFTKLTSAGSLDIDQDAAISFPELASTGVVTMTTSPLITSVSLPKLVSVTSLSDGATNSFDFTGATSIDLSSLTRYTTGTLGITTKSTGTIDLSALTTTNATTGVQAGLALNITGPKVVTLPGYETGKLTTNAEVVTLVKAIEDPALTAGNLKELHMHNLKESIDLSGFARLETLDIIGTYNTTGAALTVAGVRATGVKVTTATSLAKLDLAGALAAVEITGASNLSSVTTSGGMRSFKLTGATDLTSLTLGHGPNASSTTKRSDLTITGATNLVSLTANSVNNANVLVIEDNPALTTISLSGLTALATEAAAVTSALNVRIDDNDLQVQNVQIPTAAGTTPAIVGKVTSDSGITALKAYLDLAITSSATAGTVYVFLDNVLKVTKNDGSVVVGTDTTTSVASGVTGIDSIDTAENAGWKFIDTYKGIADTASDYETASVFIALGTEGTNLSYRPLVSPESVNVTVAGITKEFGIETANGAYSTINAVASAISTYDFGSSVMVSAALDAGAKSYNKILYNNLATGNETAVSGGGTLTWQLGSSSTASGTIITATGSTVADIQTTLIAAINTAGFGGSEYSYNATSETIASVPYIVLTRETTGTSNSDLGKGVTFPTIGFVITDTAGYTQFGATMSNVAATDYGLSVNQKNVAGLRVTIKNTSLTTALTANETVTISAVSAGVMSNTTITTLVTGTANMVPNKAVSLAFSASTAYTDGTLAGTTDATAWL
jgi:hypothetical protein